MADRLYRVACLTSERHVIGINRQLPEVIMRGRSSIRGDDDVESTTVSSSTVVRINRPILFRSTPAIEIAE